MKIMHKNVTAVTFLKIDFSKKGQKRAFYCYVFEACYAFVTFLKKKCNTKSVTKMVKKCQKRLKKGYFGLFLGLFLFFLPKNMLLLRCYTFFLTNMIERNHYI